MAMTDFSKSHDQQLDNQLCDFTDQVLSDENEAKMQETLNPSELAKLQKAILRMKAATQTARTNEAAAVRIRTRLLTEWKKDKQAERQTPKRFAWNWTAPRMALAGGFAILVIFGAIALFSPTTAPLMGTAEGSSQTWSPLFILAGIIIIVLLLWNNRHH
jgi:hypothetical protein